jgi:dolichyl-phosphate-mannose-protein mannosyltransferase
VIFATLPGVSYSSLLITTDVPLIVCWSIMLYAWMMLVRRQSLGYAILLGVAIGFGLLAKQAMLYVFLCIGVHAAVSKEARDALRGGRGILAAAIALLLFAPNVVWNAEHGFPTVRHTETNIGWQYPYIHPLRLVEYVIVQFAVFGPILMTVLLRTIWRELPKPSDPRKVLLLSFSLPVLGLLVFQALLSRARHLVGDRLSRRLDSRHRGHARAQPGDSVQSFSRSASCLRGSRRGSSGLRQALAAVRAGPVPGARGGLARIRRYRAREIDRAALWLDPGRYAGGGRRAALLSPRRVRPALRLADRSHAQRSLRDDAAI